MAAFFHDNWTTVLVGFVIALCVLIAVIAIIRDRKNGKCAAGLGCSACPDRDRCTEKDKT